MDFLTKKALTEMQFYLNVCKGNLGICFNQEVPFELLAKSPIHSFYYFQKQFSNPQLNKKYIQGELDDLPFLTDSIDVFIVWHNLDFHEAPERVVKELWRALSPNGYLLIIGSNNPCFFSSVNYIKPKEHLMNRNWLFRTLLHQGFEVEIEHTFGFHPTRILTWPTRWLDSIEVVGQFCAPMMGSRFLLKARKSVFGLNNKVLSPARNMRVVAKGLVQPTSLVIHCNSKTAEQEKK